KKLSMKPMYMIGKDVCNRLYMLIITSRSIRALLRSGFLPWQIDDEMEVELRKCVTVGLGLVVGFEKLLSLAVVDD
ncbi:hypothetical protein Tco_0927655, partial [Tanacetum coccineum]